MHLSVVLSIAQDFLDRWMRYFIHGLAILDLRVD